MSPTRYNPPTSPAGLLGPWPRCDHQTDRRAARNGPRAASSTGIYEARQHQGAFRQRPLRVLDFGSAKAMKRSADGPSVVREPYTQRAGVNLGLGHRLHRDGGRLRHAGRRQWSGIGRRAMRCDSSSPRQPPSQAPCRDAAASRESVDGRNVRMVSATRALPLSVGAGEPLCIAGESLREKLEGYIAFQIAIAQRTHLAHPLLRAGSMDLIDVEAVAALPLLRDSSRVIIPIPSRVVSSGPPSGRLSNRFSAWRRRDGGGV